MHKFDPLNKLALQCTWIIAKETIDIVLISEIYSMLQLSEYC